MPKLNALVAGSTGYIGVQLIKLLINHKFINIKYLCGNSSVGKNISSFDKSFLGKKLPKIIKFNKKLLKDVDVVFTALPNGEAQDISKHLTKNITLIDLAADFRLEKGSEYLKWYKQKHRAANLINKSLYSLPEINGKDLKEKFKSMPNVQYQSDIKQAIKSIDLKEGDLLLITGSLYGAAEVLNLN